MDRISDPLKNLLGRLRLIEPMQGWKAVEVWPEVVGPRVAANARAVACRRGTLYVEVVNAAWMNELGYLKARIQREINERVGEEAVSAIRLVPSGGTTPPGENRGDEETHES